ncbi:MAG: PIN domain-containing protein [Planctomycetaceae bacterium]|nr:PIN domain-containing protein [Planctomycetaceae bacterium]
MSNTEIKRIERVYADTSVFYGIFTARFERETKPFWNAVNRGEIIVIVSDVLAGEIERAPQNVRNFFDSLPESQIERIVSTVESDALAEQYIAENVVGKSSTDDCKHIAMATLAHAGVLVSWNFKHIVNINRIRGYNSVNEKHGYPRIEIRTPNEVIHD